MKNTWKSKKEKLQTPLRNKLEIVTLKQGRK